MKKNESRVKRFIVTDLEEFEENLVKCLIMGGISYVQIEDEFHFLDKIYHFYDIKKLREMDICASFDDMGLVRIVSPLDILGTDNIILDSKKTNFSSCIQEEKVEPIPTIKRNNAIPIYNKAMIKQQNKMVNQRLRSVK